MSPRVTRSFRLPLSGDVSQLFRFFDWTSAFANARFGLVNVDLGRSSNPAVEDEILDSVASYGKQLGRIGDALEVLMDHFQPARPLTEREETALKDMRQLLAAIAEIKRSAAER